MRLLITPNGWVESLRGLPCWRIDGDDLHILDDRHLLVIGQLSPNHTWPTPVSEFMARIAIARL